MGKQFIPEQEMILIEDLSTDQVIDIPCGEFSTWEEALLSVGLVPNTAWWAFDMKANRPLDITRPPSAGDLVMWRPKNENA